MAAKPAFSSAQLRIIHDAAKRARKRFKTQEDMALALGITQQSVSKLLKGDYLPGVKVARHVANAVGMRLEELVGEFGVEPEPGRARGAPGASRPNLDVCVAFHAGKKAWATWTLAAAREGLFGPTDFAAPEWAIKLDALEAALVKFQKDQRV